MRLKSHGVLCQSINATGSKSLLSKQSDGAQAGKFITVYMQPHLQQRNKLITDLGELLAREHRAGRINPCPTVPKSRRYSQVFMEQPLDEAMFIYGGFECDPTE